MPFPSPKLDDRSFDDLLQEAQKIIRARSPEWTDFSPSDPGMILVELFAFLTQNMLYRMNRVPEKVHIALLNLLGVTMLPPAAALVTLSFSRASEQAARQLTLPKGTRIADSTGAAVFETVADAVLIAGALCVDVTAIHADTIAAELLGTGTGEATQSVHLRRAPVIRFLPGLSTLVVGIEEDAAALEPDMLVLQYEGKPYVTWNEVVSFQDLGDSDRAYTLDRTTGTISFSPLGGAGSATLARVPPKGRAIRAWYKVGGGKAGNVAPGTLTVMRTPVPGLVVTNAQRAAGGEDAESLEHAVIRGREAVQVLSSAVTARDFERIAIGVGGISRARAYAQRELWTFGEPGVVEIRIVPTLDAVGPATLDVIHAHQTAQLLERVDTLLANHRPIGVRTQVLWTHCRPVSIASRVVISPLEDPNNVKLRILRRLDDLISPNGAWPFGKTLRASDVYEAILSEPAVRYAEQLSFTVDEGPQSDVTDLQRDPNQPRTFYAASAGRLYRTLDSGESWTTVLSDRDSNVYAVRTNQENPGFLMALATAKESDAITVQISRDSGESWRSAEIVQGEKLYDIACLRNGSHNTLFYAGRKGLHVLGYGEAASSTLLNSLLADDQGGDQAEGFYSVAVARHAVGVPLVAVARREKSGVLISREGGRAGSFQVIPGAEGRDVRQLTFQREGDRTFLWAIMAAESGASGEGVMRVEARADGIDPTGWKVVGRGWRGGSCTGLAFGTGIIAASSNRSGVALLDVTAADREWVSSTLACGLPIEEDRKTLAPLANIALGQSSQLILAASSKGIFASRDNGARYNQVGQLAFPDRAPLPPNSLYCSGTHMIDVVTENALSEE